MSLTTPEGLPNASVMETSCADNVEVNQTDEENHEDEDSFIWQDYLEVTNSIEVPGVIFSHVEQSLLNGLEEGMSIEVPHKDDPNKFWLASIVLVCGPLLRLRYVGQTEDRSLEFWCDLTKVVAHPVGWCKANGLNLTLPDELQNKNGCEDDIEKIIPEHIKSAPFELLNGAELTPIDRIKINMKLEVQDDLNPYHLWTATIIKNVGGRLLLRYDLPNATSVDDFWVFYTSSRLYHLGWAAIKGEPWVQHCPSSVKSESSEEELQIYMKGQKDIQPMPFDLFQHKTFPTHDFQVGMKLEAVNPKNMSEICPTTVVKVVDSHYFLVEIDNHLSGHTEGVESIENKLTILCTKLHPYIFPIYWARAHDIKLSPPHGMSEDFTWPSYLASTSSIAAPKSCFQQHISAWKIGFKSGMKLEAVNPINPHQICAAKIHRSVEHLCWINLESNDSDHPEHIVSHDSFEIFPVGWCEGNSYRLLPPRYYQIPSKAIPMELESEAKGACNTSVPSTQRSSWCPKIYFNHKCFSGPFLSKCKLAQLPKSVGPGPVTLVMHEVLAMLISVAYISSRVLKALQVDGRPERGTHLELLKAKHKGSTTSANVAVVTSADKVPEFCKDVCTKLQVCPYLFGPTAMGTNNCPEKCHTLTKTRFNRIWLKSGPKRSTRHLNSDQNNFGITHKRGKMKIMQNLNSDGKTLMLKSVKVDRRLKENRHLEPQPPISERDFASLLLLAEAGNGSDASNESSNNANSNALPVMSSKSSISSATGIKRKYKKKSIPMPSGIKTRGAQLPKYSKYWHRKGGWKRFDLAKPRSVSTSTSEENSVVTEELQSQVNVTPLEKGTYTKRIKYDRTKFAKVKLPKYQHAISLESNPLEWSEVDVFWFLRKTNDCSHVAQKCKDEMIDGFSFMLLNFSTIRENLQLKLNDSLKLCSHVENVKLAHYIQYVRGDDEPLIPI